MVNPIVVGAVKAGLTALATKVGTDLAEKVLSGNKADASDRLRRGARNPDAEIVEPTQAYDGLGGSNAAMRGLGGEVLNEAKSEFGKQAQEFVKKSGDKLEIDKREMSKAIWGELDGGDADVMSISGRISTRKMALKTAAGKHLEAKLEAFDAGGLSKAELEVEIRKMAHESVDEVSDLVSGREVPGGWDAVCSAQHDAAVARTIHTEREHGEAVRKGAEAENDGLRPNMAGVVPPSISANRHGVGEAFFSLGAGLMSGGNAESGSGIKILPQRDPNPGFAVGRDLNETVNNINRIKSSLGAEAEQAIDNHNPVFREAGMLAVQRGVERREALVDRGAGLDMQWLAGAEYRKPNPDDLSMSAADDWNAPPAP